MDQKETTQREQNHKKVMEAMRGEIAKLTAMLAQNQQVLARISGEASSSRENAAKIPTAMPLPTPQGTTHMPHFVQPSAEPTYSASVAGPRLVEGVHEKYVPMVVHPDAATDLTEVEYAKEGVPELLEKKLSVIEERLRAIESVDLYDPRLLLGNSLVQGIQIPKKFRVPKFSSKYTGTQCPWNHLKVYLYKMVEVVDDEKLLVHFFGESLEGSALSWFVHLDFSKVKSWKDLVDTFMKRYEYNLEVVLERSSLQAMEKWHNETVKEYSQRWRRVAKFSSKYTGTQCPRNHLKVYLYKMVEVAYDEKLLVHFFGESLEGSALSWFVDLDFSKVKSWKDLVDAFMKRYEFNLEVVPERSSLQAMKKWPNETVREYALRWREVASRIRPLLSEKELIQLFVNTLKPPYFQLLVDNFTESFKQIVSTASNIEHAIRSGKMEDIISEGNFIKRKYNDLNQMDGSTLYQPRGTWNHWEANKQHYTPSSQPGPAMQLQIPTSIVRVLRQNPPMPQYQAPAPNVVTPQYQTTATNVVISQYQTPATMPNARDPSPQNSRSPRPPFNNNIPSGYGKRKYKDILPPLPMSLAELFQRLLDLGLVTPITITPFQPPFPLWYKPNENCVYHNGLPGHNIEKCVGFQKRVKALIEQGLVAL